MTVIIGYRDGRNLMGVRNQMPHRGRSFPLCVCGIRRRDHGPGFQCKTYKASSTKNGVTHTELARRTGDNPNSVNRLIFNLQAGGEK